MKPLQQRWELTQMMKMHNHKVKQARMLRKSPMTRDVARKTNIDSLRNIMKVFELQQYYKVSKK
jgi:hypothetical protein